MTKPRNTDLHVDFGNQVVIYRYFHRITRVHGDDEIVKLQKKWCDDVIGLDKWYVIHVGYSGLAFYFRKKSYLTAFILRWT